MDLNYRQFLVIAGLDCTVFASMTLFIFKDCEK